MKNNGKANQTAMKLILWSFLAFVAVVAIGYVASIIGGMITNAAALLFAVWGLLVVAIYYYFRDPDPATPLKGGVVVSPVHGRVDTIESVENPDGMPPGAYHRIVVKPRIADAPLIYAPVSGDVAKLECAPGDRQGTTDSTLETMRIDLSGQPANVVLRLSAGRLGRRLSPWIVLGESVQRSSRIGLMILGRHCEIFLPASLTLSVKTDDLLKGGESIVAAREEPNLDADKAS
jgi:phosphatidylserine decarboxylase